MFPRTGTGLCVVKVELRQMGNASGRFKLDSYFGGFMVSGRITYSSFFFYDGGSFYRHAFLPRLVQKRYTLETSALKVAQFIL